MIYESIFCVGRERRLKEWARNVTSRANTQVHELNWCVRFVVQVQPQVSRMECLHCFSKCGVVERCCGHRNIDRMELTFVVQVCCALNVDRVGTNPLE